MTSTLAPLPLIWPMVLVPAANVELLADFSLPKGSSTLTPLPSSMTKVSLGAKVPAETITALTVLALTCGVRTWDTEALLFEIVTCFTCLVTPEAGAAKIVVVAAVVMLVF